ncbi:MAG: ABC transporter permease [Caldilineaceae bacterium]
MFGYIVRRLFEGLIVIILISIATFAIMRLMPGDPMDMLLGEGQVRISKEQMEAIRARWGLDEPYYVQYFVWVKNFVTGNLGESLVRQGVPVRDMILEAMPVTATLNIYALLIALGVSIPIGILAGMRRNSPLDYAASVGSALGIATPNFWLALMLIVIFSLMLGWLPPFGLRSAKGYILPVIVLATEQMAIFTRAHAQQHRRSGDPGLRAHGPLQRAARAHCDHAPRSAQFVAADHHRGRLPHRLPAQRHDHRGNRLRHARHRPSLHRFSLSPGLPGGAVAGGGVGRARRGCQPSDRPGVCSGRPTHADRVSQWLLLL